MRDLPSHLVSRREKSIGGTCLDADGPGEAICTVCDSRVTVGPDGLEYGHSRHGRGDFSGRCPHRPEAVDPSGPQTASGPTAEQSDVVRDENGQWRSLAADGGQVDE